MIRLRWILAGAVALTLAGSLGYARLESGRADKAEAQATLWQDRHDRILEGVRQAQIEADRQLKEREDELQRLVADAIDTGRREAGRNEARLRAAVAAERADARSLRDQLAARLSCPAEGAQAAGTAGDSGASAVGDVLAEALRVQAEATAAAERHAGEVRTLQRAWPQ